MVAVKEPKIETADSILELFAADSDAQGRASAVPNRLDTVVAMSNEV